MSFSRATWFEGSKLMSGTIRSSWIKDSIVFYPTRHPYTALNDNIQPKENWWRFPLRSVKLSSGRIYIKSKLQDEELYFVVL